MLKLYLKLCRLHQPTGFILLLSPIYIYLLLNLNHISNIYYFIIFAIGAIITRSLGCIINDLFDSNFDKHVNRTKNRPLASQELSKKQAIYLFIILGIIALFILSFFNQLAITIGLSSAFMIILYPLMKRVTYLPQLFLGIVFNSGILIASAELHQTITIDAIYLYIGSIIWTLAYDTIYALQDIKDDLKIKVKSSAILFGKNVILWINIFYHLAIILFLYSIIYHFNSWDLYIFYILNYLMLYKKLIYPLYKDYSRYNIYFNISAIWSINIIIYLIIREYI